MPVATETELTEEQQLLRDTVREFAQNELLPQAVAIDREARFPVETFRKMAELGLLGLPIPPEYEGGGVDTTTMTLVVEELAACCGSTALGVAAHTSLCLWPVWRFGTEEQRRRYVPDLASGRVLGAELMGPDAEHLAHLLAWGIQSGMSVQRMLEMPFYHPVVQEGLRTALRDAQAKLDAAGGEKRAA